MLEIVRKIGSGGMATVYLARLGGREVALKRLHPFLADDPSSLAMMEDEARLAASIRHPNVVGVLDVIGTDVVMEWVEGADLGKLVRAATQSGRRIPIDVAAALARDVLAGLHAAHENELAIVHRDVSPQNVLVGFDGRARVTDFGVAKAAVRQQHTEQGTIKGKLGYLAPEQLSGECDRRSDVYSVGAILWEILTGARLRSGTGVEVLVEILCGHVDPPSAHVEDACGLDAVVMKALARDPDDRFATAAEMIEALVHAAAPASPERVTEIVREILGAVERPAAPKLPSLVPADDEPIDPRALTPASGIRVRPALGAHAKAPELRLAANDAPRPRAAPRRSMLRR
ncbi:MAG TPA: serine/threonine-protein kinase [Labilithrix sp.]